MNYAGIQIPAGCDVQVGDNEASLATVGVLPEDSETTVGITYESVMVKGSKNEDVMRYVKNMAAEGSFTIYQILLDNIAKFAKGLMTVSTQAGTKVTGKVQTIAAGWKFLQTYKLIGQNANGSAPTVSASGSTKTRLTAGTDYDLVKGADGDWHIVLKASSSSPLVTTETVTLTLEYTPAARKVAKMGAPSVEITPQVVRFTKVQNKKKFQVTLWSATNEAGLSFSFPASSADAPASLEVTMAGGLDTTRANGEQLVEIIDEIGVSA